MKAWNAVRMAKAGYIAISVLFCVGGLLLFFYPYTTATALCYLGGGLLILGGAVKLAGYFSRDLYRLAFQFDLAYGLLLMALGLIMVFRPQGVITLLHFLIGVVLLSDGLFKIQTALDARQFGLSWWPWIAGIAVLTIVCGVVLIINPFKGAAILAAFMGVGLLAEGILNLCVAVWAVKVIERQEEQAPKIIDIP